MPPVRLAIVGCGAAARGCHVPALPPLKGDVQLTALIDRDPRQAQAALELYRELGGTGADKVVIATDPAEAADAFDAAVVVVPHTVHARTVGSLLAAGKHVLLEKPMTTSVEDARHLVALAADASAPLLAMAHPRRLFPAYAWVKRLVEGGDLGDVVRVDWAEGHPYAWEPVSWSMFDRRLAGGGVLTDTASHVFDALLWWLGPDVEVVRYEDNSLGGVETDASAHLRFGTVDVNCEFSRLRDLGISCRVTGTKATVTIGTDFPAGECTLVASDGVELHRGDVEAVAPAQGEWELLFTEQLANFAAAVRGTAAVHSGPEDGLRVVELIQECYGGAHEDATQPWTTRGAAPDADGAALDGRTVAVTGASGFIGGRVVERLTLGTQARVRPVVRGFGRAARLSVLPQDRLEFRQADLLGTDGLRAAFEGCDTVVHCAFGSAGDEADRWAASVEGTANVLAAARAAGVRRVVHLSTIDVYDPGTTGELTEESPARPADPADREYEQQKLAAERLVLNAHGPDLETVVLQPGVVFGPWGGQWTTAQLQRAEGDFAALPTGEDSGMCNAVYVDDLVDAVLLAAGEDAAAGQRFLIGNDEALGWGRFFDAIRSLRGLGELAGQCAGDPVPDWELDLYRSTARARYDKAKRMLGFAARTPFAEGVELTGQWAAWTRQVPEVRS
ncbi:MULTISPECIES: NAD-dependent epimerase/dehydratase family protein [unclassified Streptomyces]|uniref:NAD-dependent epimerase/dehydratase family protein n=1 Tax=unclassified Streptomyces TaxID=2593676 RepID=UPI00106E82E7|nr:MULTISPECIES: NAD-dependent epimerase/dehydratase family protein [unclassified Streptomyces]MBH5129100.1 NAD-dependent epimerase/dehydratase family protein [Streptomyces sp. HB-N217]